MRQLPIPSTPLPPTSLACHASLDTLRHRLTPSDPFVPLPPLLSTPLSTLTTLLHTSLTNTNSPSRSALLLGPPTTAKSALLTRALETLRTNHNVQPVIARIHGPVHNAPSTAFRSIAHQLITASEHLSHPRQHHHQHPNLPHGIMECQAVIRSHLSDLRARSTPFLLILDDLHHFATDTASQNVLYALLNLLQDPLLPAACVAISSHIDVEDALEKRVRSRFAPRQIVMPLPENPQQVLQYLEQVIQPTHKNARNSDISTSDSEEYQTTTRNSRRSGPMPNSPPRTEEQKQENDDELAESAFEQALAHFHAVAHDLITSTRFTSLVNRYLQRTRVLDSLIHAFDSALVAAFDDLLLPDHHNLDHQWDVEKRVDTALHTMNDLLFPPDPLEQTMATLSVVELALLASLRKLESASGSTSTSTATTAPNKLTFAQVLDIYKTLNRGEEGLLAGDDGEVIASREVAEKSWERLIESGLVARDRIGPRHMRAIKLNVEALEVDRAVQRHRFATTRLKRWAKGEIRR